MAGDLGKRHQEGSKWEVKEYGRIIKIRKQEKGGADSKKKNDSRD